MASRVGWFALGFIGAIVALLLGGYVFIRVGGMPMATSVAPLPLERMIAGLALAAQLRKRGTTEKSTAGRRGQSAGGRPEVHRVLLRQAREARRVNRSSAHHRCRPCRSKKLPLGDHYSENS